MNLISRRIIFASFIFLTLIVISCSKNENSPDTLHYSLDGGPVRTCLQRSIGVEALGPYCDLKVGRMGHFMFGQNADLEISVDSDCNIINGPLPYSTTKFIVAINDNNDKMMSPQVSSYIYYLGLSNDSLNRLNGYHGPYDNTINHFGGQVTLELTYRKNGRIKGTIKGDICSGDVHDLVPRKLDCDFDIVIPFH
jgi:hypothetical protein